MSLFLYEWKKLCKRKSFLICVIAVFLVHLLSIILPYYKDMSANGELYETDKYYTELFSDTIDNTLLQRIQQYELALTSGKQKPFSGSVDHDLTSIHRITSDVKKQQEYNQAMINYKNQIKENILWFQDKEENIRVKDNQRLYTAYANHEIDGLSYHCGWDRLFEHQSSTMFILFILFMSVPYVWSNEYEDEMVQILFSTKKGYKRIHHTKLRFAISLAIGAVLVFSISELLVFGMLYGFHGGMSMLFENESYRYAVLPITNIAFWCLLTLLKCLVFSFFSILILTISLMITNSILSLTATAASAVIFLGIAEAGYYTWHPFGGLYLHESVRNDMLYHIFHNSLFQWEAGCITGLAGLLIVFFLYGITCRRKRL